jgi:hypothetical protein
VGDTVKNDYIHASMVNLDPATALIEEIEDEENRTAIRLVRRVSSSSIGIILAI